MDSPTRPVCNKTNSGTLYGISIKGGVLGIRLYRITLDYDTSLTSTLDIQGVPGGKVNILRGHSIVHSKQKCSYEHVSYSERFPR